MERERRMQGEEEEIEDRREGRDGREEDDKTIWRREKEREARERERAGRRTGPERKEVRM